MVEIELNVKRWVNETAYADYRSAARDFPEVKHILEKLRDARHASRQSRRSDIAQLHYAHGSDHRPLRLISRKIAHSDPAGATLFG